MENIPVRVYTGLGAEEAVVTELGAEEAGTADAGSTITKGAFLLPRVM